jgi:nucleotide-binding universal stress UspA family protein
MKNHILVPFDFSDESHAALDTAIKLAQRITAKISLLNVFELPEGESDVFSFSDDDLAEYKRLIDDTTKKHEARLQEVIDQTTFLNAFISPVIKRGFVHKEIIDTCEEVEATLVILGSRGMSSLQDYIIGTNVEKIIKGLHCPVLVVSEKSKNFKLDHLVFASNFRVEEVPEFDFFKDLSQKFHSTVHLLRVNTPGDFKRSKEMRESMTSFANYWDIKKYTSHIYSDFSIEEGMLEFAQSIDTDLLCIHRRQHRSFFSFLNSRVTDEVVKKSSVIPILILT